MPAITQEERIRLEDPSQPIENVGNLTYILTRETKRYWINSSRRYVDIASILGALICTLFYFWDYIGRDYERRKTEENGPIY